MAETKPKLLNSDKLEEALDIVYKIVCESTSSNYDGVEQKSAQIEATGRIVAAMIGRGRL